MLGEAVGARLARQGCVFDGHPFRVDRVPRHLGSAEWEDLRAGLGQRVRALDAFVADAHGERAAVCEGVVPARLLEGSSTSTRSRRSSRRRRCASASPEHLGDGRGGLTAIGEVLAGPLRAGTLALVNAPGAGVADDKLTHAYVGDLSASSAASSRCCPRCAPMTSATPACAPGAGSPRGSGRQATSGGGGRRRPGRPRGDAAGTQPRARPFEERPHGWVARETSPSPPTRPWSAITSSPATLTCVPSTFFDGLEARVLPRRPDARGLRRGRDGGRYLARGRRIGHLDRRVTVAAWARWPDPDRPAWTQEWKRRSCSWTPTRSRWRPRSRRCCRAAPAPARAHDLGDPRLGRGARHGRAPDGGRDSDGAGPPA